MSGYFWCLYIPFITMKFKNLYQSNFDLLKIHMDYPIMIKLCFRIWFWKYLMLFIIPSYVYINDSAIFYMPLAGLSFVNPIHTGRGWMIFRHWISKFCFLHFRYQFLLQKQLVIYFWVSSWKIFIFLPFFFTYRVSISIIWAMGNSFPTILLF